MRRSALPVAGRRLPRSRSEPQVRWRRAGHGAEAELDPDGPRGGTASGVGAPSIAVTESGVRTALVAHSESLAMLPPRSPRRRSRAPFPALTRLEDQPLDEIVSFPWAAVLRSRRGRRDEATVAARVRASATPGRPQLARRGLQRVSPETSGSSSPSSATTETADPRFKSVARSPLPGIDNSGSPRARSRPRRHQFDPDRVARFENQRGERIVALPPDAGSVARFAISPPGPRRESRRTMDAGGISCRCSSRNRTTTASTRIRPVVAPPG